MKLTIDYKKAHCDFAQALADAVGIESDRIRVAVAPPLRKIPFCAEWRVVNKCADVVAYVDGELLQLNII